MRYLPSGSDRIETAPSDMDIVQRRRIARAARRARQRRTARMAQTEPEEQETAAPLAEVVNLTPLLRLNDRRS